MSSTFNIVPENILRDHCRASITGICEAYTQFATGKRLPTVTETVQQIRRRAYVEEFSSSQSSKFYADYVSELVMSWRSMFERSAEEANVSFYYDDSVRRGVGIGQFKGMHSTRLPVPPPASSIRTSISSQSKNLEEVRRWKDNNKKKSIARNSYTNEPTTRHADFIQEQIAAFNDSRGRGISNDSILERKRGVVGGTTGIGTGSQHKPEIASPIHSSPTPTPYQQYLASFRYGRKKREILTGKNAEQAGSTSGDGIVSLAPDEQGLNANVPSVQIAQELSTTTPSTDNSQLSTSSSTPKPSTSTRIDKGTTNGTHLTLPTPFPSSTTVFISDDLTTTTRGAYSSSELNEQEGNLRKNLPLNASLKRIPLAKPTSSSPPPSPPPPQTSKSFEGEMPKGAWSQSIKLNSTQSRKSNSNNSSGGGEGGRNMREKIVDFGLISKGPKEMLGFVQEEMFTRWPTLLENVQMFLEQRNMTSLQLVSPEATRIKMHIEVRPFGPDPFKDARKRLKATQQTLFDYPWLTMVQLYGKISGNLI
jgi:hypothetical protein